MSGGDYNLKGELGEAAAEERAGGPIIVMPRHQRTRNTTVNSGRFAWTNAAVLQLCSLYKDYKWGFSNPGMKKFEVWNNIAAGMIEKGYYQMTGFLCDQKMRALKKRYKVIKSKWKESGRGDQSKWQYFDILDDIFTSDCEDMVTLTIGETFTGQLSEMASPSQVGVRGGQYDWTYSAVSLLCSLYKDYRCEFSNPDMKKYEVWNNIAAEMNDKGYQLIGPICDDKMRSLKNRHKVIKEKMMESGQTSRPKWKYFSLIDDVVNSELTETPFTKREWPTDYSTDAFALEFGHQSAVLTAEGQLVWSHDAVLTLCSLCKEYSYEFSSSGIKKYTIWNNIAAEMCEKGYPLTGPACDEKMRTLKKRYKIIQKSKKLGKGGPQKWLYYEALDDIYGSGPGSVTRKKLRREDPEYRPSLPRVVFDQPSPADTPVGGQYVWSQEAVLALCSLYKEYRWGFSSPDMKKFEVWNNIAASMMEKGYEVTGHICDQKMRTLKQRYKIIKNKSKDGEHGSQTKWMYYDVLDDIFSSNLIVVPVNIEQIHSIKEDPVDISTLHHPPPVYGHKSPTDTEGGYTLRNRKNEPTILQHATPKKYTTTSTTTGFSALQQSLLSQASGQFVWSHEAVLQLCSSYKDYRWGFSNRDLKKYQVWNNIAFGMSEKGFHLTGIACDEKMRALKQRYKIIKDKTKDGGHGSRTKWLYFDILDEIFTSEHDDIPLTTDESVTEHPTDISNLPHVVFGEHQSVAETGGAGQYVWSHAAILQMCSLFKEHRWGFSHPRKKKYEVWNSIAAGMIEKGYPFAGPVCDQKMRTLKRRFIKIKDRIKGESGQTHWPYFDIMNDLFNSNNTASPMILSGSPTGTTGRVSSVKSRRIVKIKKEKNKQQLKDSSCVEQGKYTVFDFLRDRPQSCMTVLSKWIVPKSSLRGAERDLIQDFTKEEAITSVVCWFPPKDDPDYWHITTLVKNDSSREAHWLPQPGYSRGCYNTFEESEFAVDHIVLPSETTEEAEEMQVCDDNADEDIAASGSIRRKAEFTTQDSSPKKKRMEEEEAAKEKAERNTTEKTALLTETAMYEKLSQQIQETVRKEVQSALSRHSSEIKNSLDTLNRLLKSIIPGLEKRVPDSGNGDALSENISEVKTSIDNLNQLLQPAIAGPSEKVTDDDKSTPQVLVPSLPKDPCALLTYFGFPADTPESLILKHQQYFAGGALTEPMRSHRSALKKAFIHLCPPPKPNAGKEGLTQTIRQLLHYLAPRDVWRHFCLKGSSKTKCNMDSEVPKFVRVIQATIFTKWQVSEPTTNGHLSQILQREGDHSATPQTKNKTSRRITVNGASVGTSGQQVDTDEQELSDSDEEARSTVSSDHSSDREVGERSDDETNT